MKTRLFKLLSLCLLITLLFTVAVPAFAKSSKPTMPKHVFWAREQQWGIGLDNIPDNAKLVKVKSSNPSVLKIEYGETFDDITWIPLKKGTSKVTVTYKIGSKEYTVSRKYTVKKFPSPFSTLKVNGKSIKPMADRKNIYNYNLGNKTKATITFKVKSGWKITERGLDVEGKNRVNLKSGKAVKIPKGKFANAVLGLTNKKTGDFIVFFINLDR